MVRHMTILVLLGVLVTQASAWTSLFRPTRFVEKWVADTLFVGASFRYAGGPLGVTLLFSESSTSGRLYAINTANGDTVNIMSNRAGDGHTVNLLALSPFVPGREVVFMYVPQNDGIPRFTGPGNDPGRFYNVLSSDGNRNPARRFGRRWSVAGQIRPGTVELGFEDAREDEIFADMDFNDVHFQVQGVTLLLYGRTSRQRDYIW